MAIIKQLDLTANLIFNYYLFKNWLTYRKAMRGEREIFIVKLHILRTVLWCCGRDDFFTSGEASISMKGRLFWSRLQFVALISAVFAGTWLTSPNFFEQACSAILQIHSKVSFVFSCCKVLWGSLFVPLRFGMCSILRWSLALCPTPAAPAQGLRRSFVKDDSRLPDAFKARAAERYPICFEKSSRRF